MAEVKPEFDQMIRKVESIRKSPEKRAEIKKKVTFQDDNPHWAASELLRLSKTSSTSNNESVKKSWETRYNSDETPQEKMARPEEPLPISTKPKERIHLRKRKPMESKDVEMSGRHARKKSLHDIVENLVLTKALQNKQLMPSNELRRKVVEVTEQITKNRTALEQRSRQIKMIRLKESSNAEETKKKQFLQKLVSEKVNNIKSASKEVEKKMQEIVEEKKKEQLPKTIIVVKKKGMLDQTTSAVKQGELLQKDSAMGHMTQEGFPEVKEEERPEMSNGPISKYRQIRVVDLRKCALEKTAVSPKEQQNFVKRQTEVLKEMEEQKNVIKTPQRLVEEVPSNFVKKSGKGRKPIPDKPQLLEKSRIAILELEQELGRLNEKILTASSVSEREQLMKEKENILDELEEQRTARRQRRNAINSAKCARKKEVNRTQAIEAAEEAKSKFIQLYDQVNKELLTAKLFAPREMVPHFLKISLDSEKDRTLPILPQRKPMERENFEEMDLPQEEIAVKKRERNRLTLKRCRENKREDTKIAWEKKARFETYTIRLEDLIRQYQK